MLYRILMDMIRDKLIEGFTHHQAGRLDQAVAAYRGVLAIDPEEPDALHLLGVISHQVSQQPLAVQLITQAITKRPDNPDYRANLAEALKALGRFEEARHQLDTAIALSPNNPVLRLNIGTLLAEMGDEVGALAAFGDAVALGPDLAEAHSNLGNLLLKKGRVIEALDACRRAAQLNPRLIEAKNNLGNALMAAGDKIEAEAAYRQALSLDPDFPRAHYNLGDLLIESGRYGEGIAALKTAESLDPTMIEAKINLGNALADQGRIDEALAKLNEALQLAPNNREAFDSLLVAALNRDGITQADNIALHAQWAANCAPLLGPPVLPAGTRDPARRLRIGYLSPDFFRHPVGWFLSGVLPRHDKGNFEIFAYADLLREDEITAKLKSAADHWRMVYGVSDDELREQILADGIDILVDLAGHFRGNRLGLFAKRAAPVQITWAGYVGTTGLPAIDWLICDPIHVPVSEDGIFVEKLCRLPHSYVCYSPPETAPELAPPPSLSGEGVVFASFNNLAKLSPATVGLWSEILKARPDGKLLLKSKPLGDEATRELVIARFAEQGIGRERLILEGASPHGELLARYNAVDVALDPLPYSGGLTTLEALWMGVPVVTLAGSTFAGRHSAAHLTNAGLAELVTDTPETYRKTALRLAANVSWRAEFRQNARTRLAASPLLNHELFTRTLEAGLRGMWQIYCQG
jgi:protein O-GlcNAc transferase